MICRPCSSNVSEGKDSAHSLLTQGFILHMEALLYIKYLGHNPEHFLSNCKFLVPAQKCHKRQFRKIGPTHACALAFPMLLWVPGRGKVVQEKLGGHGKGGEGEEEAFHGGKSAQRIALWTGREWKPESGACAGLGSPYQSWATQISATILRWRRSK